MKLVLINLSYENKGQNTLNVEIIADVFDELRRERKTRMVLRDEEIEAYIKMDLSDKVIGGDNTPQIEKVLHEKKLFKCTLCQRTSIIRLGYMLKVLQTIHPGKASMLGADAFAAKVKLLEQKELQKKNSEFRKTNGGDFENISEDAGEDENQAEEVNMERIISDPILKDLNVFVQGLKKQIEELGKEKLEMFQKLYKKFTFTKPLDTIEENLNQLEEKRGM